MQDFVDNLLDSDILSDNELYRGYLKELSFRLPETMLDAKSVIIMAIYTPLGLVNFHHKGERYEIAIPPQYYRLGITQDQLKELIQDTMIKTEGYKLEYANSYLFLKYLAATTGLAKYGRNNICYVDEMGSMISLHAFLTNFEFTEDNYGEVQLMEKCTSCGICLKYCPTGAIREDRFVVDIGKCITLYNETDEEFPEWLNSDVHNSLMGCMKCQFKCPANSNALKNTLRLDDITEEETMLILQGVPTPELIESLTIKLRGFYPATSESYFQMFTRNLRAIIPYKE
jgi:epoxyqueuosine reductase